MIEVKKLIKKSIVLFSAMVVVIWSTSAAEAADCVRLMGFSYNLAVDVFDGDTRSKDFTLNGDELYLTPVAKERGGYVVLSGNRGTIMSFNLPDRPYVNIYKFSIKGTDREFLFVEVGKNGVSDSLCTNFWIVGKYKKGDRELYVVYSELKNLIDKGLIHQSIDVVLNRNTGELWVQGLARDRDCWDMTDPDNEHFAYKGHSARLSDRHMGYCLINAISYFWDEKSQWFGTVYHDETIM